MLKASIQTSRPPTPSTAMKSLGSLSSLETVEMDDDEFEKDRRTFDRNLFPKQAKKQKKTNKCTDPSNIEEYLGPWARAKTASSEECNLTCGPSAEQRQKAKEAAQKNPLLNPIEEKTTSAAGDFTESCTFHINSDEFQNLVNCKEDSQHSHQIQPSSCKPPTKVAHVWSGHSKAVTSIRLFPNTAHLLLSCSLDHKIKLWRYAGSRECIATYLGHNKPVRDINFTPDGTQFISCSFDRTVKLWDVETGKVMNRFKTDQLPFVTCFSPENPSEFFVGCNDGCIYQFDVRTADPLKTFEGHLGPINTISFPWSATAPSTFLSTSDDKTVRIWDARSAQVEKYLSKASYTAISSVALHPTQPMLACQTARSQIITVDVSNGGFTFKPKKFFGHRLNGFGCPVTFSPDGTWLASGDGEGSLIVWRWEKALFHAKIRIHEKAVMGAVWHPFDQSSLLTCSWDGSIKLLSV